ncbi:MAG TPA: YceH family protein [Solirubrobacteraceae bacterium]|nr:YceH family protein [Solirubrobacteraceae bacterium]
MHFSELTPVEQRVLGCLIEKRWTTPDQYPLSINALRLACNQSTNRDPVTDYDESDVRHAAERLSRYGLTRLASGAGSRATKYRHLAEEGLGLDREHLAVLGILLLRGPQTPGELKSRSDRMAHLDSLEQVERILGDLADRGYVARIERRPGQKEDRFRQLLGGEGSATEAAPAPAVAPAPLATAGGYDAPALAPARGRYETDDEPLAVGGFDEPVAVSPSPSPSSSPSPSPSPSANGSYDELEARVAALEADLAALREQLADLLS